MSAIEKLNSSNSRRSNPASRDAVALLVSSGILLALFLIVGCGKSNQSSSSAPASQPAPSTQTSPAPSTSTAPAPPTPGPDGSTADTTAKLAAADWAIKQDAIKNDPNGEWAILATASSSYNDAQGQAAWSRSGSANDPGMNRLYRELIDVIAERTGAPLRSHFALRRA